MRKRQLITRVIPGGMAAAVLILGSTSVLGQSARAGAAFEIVDSAGTGVIVAAVQQIAAGLTASPPASLSPASSSAAVRAEQVGSAAAGSDFVASVNTVDTASAVNVSVDGQSNGSAQSTEAGNKLIIAQYN